MIFVGGGTGIGKAISEELLVLGARNKNKKQILFDPSPFMSKFEMFQTIISFILIPHVLISISKHDILISLLEYILSKWVF